LSESWGKGKRFGIAPIGQGRCYWYATANRPAGWSDDPADRRKLLLELFGDWHKPVTDLISAASSEEIIAGPICDRVARRQWGRGRVTLLGDAAHPMTPNLGQGAATAIEDAWTVARCLEKERTVEAALRRYEHLRAPRLARVQSISRLLGRVIQLESPVAIACRDFVLRLTPNGMSSSVLKRVFSFDP
jgi:2-polyprenyl-6-methoxyphenol hydroxylase-like FAD-dependent oxidoreductase